MGQDLKGGKKGRREGGRKMALRPSEETTRSPADFDGNSQGVKKRPEIQSS